MAAIRAGLIVVLVLLAMRGATAQDCGTDVDGLIQTNCWLATGPYQNPAGCGGDDGNYIASSFIGCEYPAEGDGLRNDYDPVVAASDGLTDNGVNADVDGDPIWYAWDDGTLFDGNQNFLDGPGGNPGDNHMMWLATYVEYVGVQDPVNINLCLGSDDSAQVWINGDEVFNNFGTCRGVDTCQDVIPVSLPGPGLYCIRGGVWQGNQGWDLRLALQDDIGFPILSDDPDWIFHGRERPEDFETMVPGGTACPPCEVPVEDASCEPGPGGLTVTWTISPGCECTEDTELRIGGVTVATVGPDITQAVIPSAQLPATIFTVDIVNCSGLRAFCSPACTDADGLILDSCWLATGPYQNPFGCNGANENFIAPSVIGCEYPAEGEELRGGYDPFLAASGGLTEIPGVNANGVGDPIWYAWNDGTNNGNQNFLNGPGGNPGDNHFIWLATYVEYTGNQDPVNINLCLGSDDSAQVWINDTEVFSIFGACRGIGTCQNVVPVSLPGPGLYCIRAAVWQGGEGWDLRLGLQDDIGVPILSDDPDWIFHGRSRPADFENTVPGGTDCPECDKKVVDVTCEFGPVGLGQGLIVQWAMPPDSPDCECATEVQIGDVTVATVAAGVTQATIVSTQLPQGIFTVDVVNCSGLAASCTPFCTDDEGLFVDACWLATGPYQNPVGCGGDDGNYIAPSFIGCEYPVVGEELAFGYDPLVAASGGLIEVPGVNANDVGDPIWYAWNDSTLNGTQDFLTGPGGNPGDNHMIWLATYVEYAGLQDPVNLNLCLGSDDAAQVWINDTEVFNNFGTCRGIGTGCLDVIPVSLPGPGVYCIRGGVWQGSLGWNLRLGLQDDVGISIVDGDPDWVFHGRERPDGFEPTECCPPVLDLVCTENAEGGVDVTWQNPEDSCGEEIRILVYGEEVATEPANATSFTVPAAELPFPGTITVDNGGFARPSCSVILSTEFQTDQGFVSAWLHLGPYAQQDGAAPGCDLIREDHLTDGVITELEIEPVDSDQIGTDYGPPPAGAAASLGLNPADLCFDCNPGDIPTWRAFTSFDGVTDTFNVDNLVSTGDNQMCYGLFYIDVLMDVTVDVGVGSDDSIQVLAAPVGSDLVEIWCNSVDRGAGNANTVQDVIRDVALTQGLWKFMVKVFDGEGGHGWRLRFQDSTGGPLLPGDVTLEPGTRETNCDNGVDDDEDGATDCDDSDCDGDPACVPQNETNCNNGVDDDEDGATDCDDPDCAGIDPCVGGGFVRADVNADAAVNITDAIYLLASLFLGGPPPPCSDAADANDDAAVNITDAIYLLSSLFLGGPPPPAPSICGDDPSADGLDCLSFPPCA